MVIEEQRKKLGKERLQQIIDQCRSVEERGLDPFVVDIDDILLVVREYFPDWELPEEIILDAEAIHQISSVIKLQSDWVKHRSTSLYTDPFLLEEKLQRLSKEELVEIFMKVWNPIIELEQISPYSLNHALKYWRDLLPLNERWLRDTPLRVDSKTATREDLINQRIFAEKPFSDALTAFWEELKRIVGKEGKIRFWDFIGADTYSETVNRAYMTSFLVTYGYATLEIYQLEEEIFIKPFNEPKSLGKGQMISIPLSIDFEEWKKWRENEQD